MALEYHAGDIGFKEEHLVTSDLWIRAVINTAEKGLVDVVWGHFYANPKEKRHEEVHFQQ